MWAYVYLLIHLILFGEMTVYLSPFRGRPAISCFDLSLNFFYPCQCLLILPQSSTTCWKRMISFLPWWKLCWEKHGTAYAASPAFPPLPPYGFAQAQQSCQGNFNPFSRPALASVLLGTWAWQAELRLCLSEVSGNLHDNSDLTFQSIKCVWFRFHLAFPMCRSLQEDCSSVPDNTESWNGLGWKGTLKIPQVQPSCHGQGWQNRTNHVGNPFAVPFFFTCNSEVQGDYWNPLDDSFESAFSLGFLVFEALHTQPRVLVMRCCSLKCVHKCRFAEAKSYIKR